MRRVITLHIPIVLNVRGVKDFRQAEIHAAEPLVPEPSAFEVEMAILNCKTVFFNSAPKR
jgi:hypothetical protein